MIFSNSSSRHPPHPSKLPFIGNILDIRKGPLEFFTRTQKKLGNCVRFSFGPFKVHLVTHPDDVQKVLQDPDRIFGKQTPTWQKLRRVLGNGLLTSDGEDWQEQRRMIQPLFRPEKIRQTLDWIPGFIQSEIEKWMDKNSSKKQIDFSTVFSDWTREVAARSFLGVSLIDEKKKFSDLFNWLAHESNRRATELFEIPLFIPTFRNLRFKKTLKLLHRFMQGVIEKTRLSETREDNLLSLLLQTQKDFPGKISDSFIRQELLTFFIAGHETTAHALTWTFFLLSIHPEIQSSLRSETKTVLSDKLPTWEKISSLVYTEQVLKEGMRLYPPASFISRSVSQECELSGYRIPKGSIVLLSPFITHRLESFWKEPDCFNPDRFHPDHPENRHRYAHFPFGGGARQCIGMYFAMIEMKMIVSALIQKFSFSLVPGQTIEPELAITLRPKNGVRLEVTKLEE